MMMKIFRKIPPNRISGFTLISAIFLVVVLSLIGAFIVNLSSLTRASANLSLQGIKAYYAASSGLEWALQIATTPVAGLYNCPSGTAISTCPTGYTGTTNTLTLTQQGLKNFSVVVTCCQNAITEGSITYNLYLLNAVSQYSTSGSQDFASRSLFLTATDPRG
jgi:MSHA biogenesis protein MshP